MIRHVGPSSAYELDALIQGVLELEGDCLYVRIDEVDERYPIVWPASTTWDAAQEVVITPMGDRLEIGDQISGGGGYFHAEGLEDSWSLWGRTCLTLRRQHLR